jgi:arylsulfatase A-like enzyme
MPHSPAVRHLLLFIAVLSLLGACGEASCRSVRPNVVILVMDTTRGDRVSFNGYPRPTTPRIAEFARDAVVYENAWSPAGWTGPAHASLLTGLRPENHGFWRGNREYLPPEILSIASRFRDAGYSTGCLTNNDVLSPESGLLEGFELRDLRYRDWGRPYPWAPETHHRALEWIDASRREGRPFFLLVNDMEPHFRYIPPEPFLRRFAGDRWPVKDLLAARQMHASRLFAHNLHADPIPARLLRLLSDLYDGEIAALDDSIGDFLDQLRERGVLDETVVVIVGDHGENLGEHGFVDHMFSLHRTIRHVPLVVRYPGRFDGGQRVSDVVRLEDVPPTLLELAGLEVPPNLDGESLRDLKPGRIARALLGPPNQFLDRVGPQLRPGDGLLRHRTTVRAVFDGRHHLLRYSDGRKELYDLSRDPLETRELIGSRSVDADVLLRLQGLLED